MRPGFEVGAQGPSRLTSKEHDALLPPLPHHPEGASLQVERREVQAHELGAAKARRIEQLQDGPSPEGRPPVARDLDQGDDLSLLQGQRNPSLEARGEQGLGRVLGEGAFPAEVAEEGAQSRQLAGGRDLLQTLTVEVREEGADEEVVHVPGARLPTELLHEVQPELRQVAGVGAAGVRRGVALVGQVSKESLHGLAHGRAARRTWPRAGPPEDRPPPAPAENAPGFRGRDAPWPAAFGPCP